eukprot:CAMPEP_0197673750 /NCGR_PEP_ID=MMETSP1338-20131121/81589_1 /TAXON_ID=43686 ORGANISM="Pelagodinium beii, Strain RCC1491" /NCGR_SAMPLE_ID=MMETSP1338 /ASSEMBLY_ACC=CAM_ASM_000754 /LENGTH=82 /DNA_ID=CAMNT_0043254043 /DNA_START=68 /DNA_END=316 /DNA_ORIENTATION=+
MDIDGMEAIIYLLNNPNIDVGITVTANGFSNPWAGVDSAMRLTHKYNMSDMPVAFQEGYLGQTMLDMDSIPNLHPYSFRQPI